MADPINTEKTPDGAAATTGFTTPACSPCDETQPPDCCMVIFGASGDLVRRKLMPALYKLFRCNLLPKGFFVIGAARTAMTDDSFRAETEASLRAAGDFDEGLWAEFSKSLFYRSVTYADHSSYSGIKGALDELAPGRSNGNCVFYLATPPAVYAEISRGIIYSGLRGSGWSRLIIEKPFGSDLKSALALNSELYTNYNEDQIYRIDHYLGKETVQNILMLRFANAIFEPLWNRRYIDHVQISAAETLGVEKRSGYYEQAGVLRDMFQNHMLQVMCLAAMEPPSVYESELVRDERVKVLRALRPFNGDDINDHLVIGQYGEGAIDGSYVRDYRREEGVAQKSQTPTFAAMKLYVDNWRWQGVPFYLRSGKRMKKRFTQVTIQFKGVPHSLFRRALPGEPGPNALILRMQPDERVQLKFHTKSPGGRVCLRDVVMDFPYTLDYMGVTLDAYERLLLDCMLGDKMLFVRSDGMALSWSFLTTVLNLIEERTEHSPKLYKYTAGSYGPAEAETLIQKDGRDWVDYGEDDA
ncbi:MAG: glucose-6-phosphate dehydrogenase [Deltaproteobacteria bacterium]|nr:glucose-6-phosphate dehydrogenase [Deltaproteobacteria bacterium]